MYDELISRLKNLAMLTTENGKSEIPFSAEAVQAIREIATEAADAIEELSKSCWIPVTEPPKYGDYYLVCDNCGRVYTTPFGNIGWWLESNVTHWMPLPKPPKEEG